MPVEHWNALFNEASVLSRSIAGSFPLARFTFTDPEVASGILGTKRVISACLRVAPKQPRADPAVHERLQFYMVMLRDLTLLRMALEMKTAKGAKFEEQRSNMEAVIANPAPEVVAAIGVQGEEG